MTSLNTEMEMLLWSALLYIVQVLIAAVATDLKNGVAWGLGNRDDIPASSGFVGRSQRAYSNMAENLLPFACIALLVQSTGNTGEMSALGASVFFYSRVLHAGFYLAGITVVRSLAYFGGLAGMGMMVYQVL
jgi:uncharacterized MAPEG superfamily protein